MKPSPRIILGSAAAALIIASIILSLAFFKKDQSYIFLTSQKNRFDLNFSIKKTDQDNFQKILASLGIPQEVKDGVNFELDSTSSARLNFLTPVKTNLTLKDKVINFSGETSVPLISNQPTVEQIKVPNSTNVAIFAPDLKSFVKARLNLAENISAWIDKNFSGQNGSYLVIYGLNPDYSLLVRKDQINFDELKNLKDTNGDTLYKEEASGDVKLHFLQIPNINSDKQQTLTFFQLDEYQVMSSSPDAAKSLIDAQKSSPSHKFPKGDSPKQAALIIEFSNPDENIISDQAESFLLQPWERPNSPKAKLASSLKQIRDASFALKERSFSGLINLK